MCMYQWHGDREGVIHRLRTGIIHWWWAWQSVMPQQPSSHSEDSRDDEKEEPEVARGRPEATKCMCSVLSWHSHIQQLELQPQILHVIPHPRTVVTISYKFLLMIFVQKAKSSCHQYYIAKGDGNPAYLWTNVALSCFDSKDGPQSAWHIETVPV
jgi:hypothetical protein